MSLQRLLVCFLVSQALPQTTAHGCREFESLVTRPSEGQQIGPSQELALSMNQLCTLVKETPTELEESYNEIALVNQKNSRDGSRSLNPHRHDYALPYDFNRPPLNTAWYVGNFISASKMFVKIPGPKPFTLNYIAAECPLPGNGGDDTRPEFWSMVMNSGSTLVVMMDSPDEVECQGHLPQSKKQPWQSTNKKISVELVKTEQKETYSLHEITITSRDYNGAEIHKTVNYVQRRFSVDSFKLFNTFLYIVRQLRDKMIQEDSMAPLIVLCKDGVGWTGMFILADVALYRIDVYQAVYPLALIKELRDLRPSFIPEFDQFKWICKFILDYYNSKHPGLLDSLN